MRRSRSCLGASRLPGQLWSVPTCRDGRDRKHNVFTWTGARTVRWSCIEHPLHRLLFMTGGILPSAASASLADDFLERAVPLCVRLQRVPGKDVPKTQEGRGASSHGCQLYVRQRGGSSNILLTVPSSESQRFGFCSREDNLRSGHRTQPSLEEHSERRLCPHPAQTDREGQSAGEGKWSCGPRQSK
jgi:hypothetical protein